MEASVVLGVIGEEVSPTWGEAVALIAVLTVTVGEERMGIEVEVGAGRVAVGVVSPQATNSVAVTRPSNPNLNLYIRLAKRNFVSSGGIIKFICPYLKKIRLKPALLLLS